MHSEFLEARHVLATLSGVAFDDSVLDDEAFTAGEAVSGIDVTATNESNGQQYNGTTNGSGNYSLSVPNGNYTLVATGSSLVNDIVYTDIAVSTSATVDLDTTEPGQYVRTMSDPWIPNPVDGSTFRSKLSGGTGFWDDASTWSANRAPNANDRVIIQAGDEVVVRNTSAIAKSIGVYHGGKLSFQTNVNTELQVVTLLVLGDLEIGTAAAPISPNVTAKVTFRDVAINLNTDPGQYGNGLLALNSATVRIHGATLNETFERVAVEPLAGATTLTLSQAPTGWKVGDQVLLPDTRHIRFNQVPKDGNYVPEWEELTISAISGNTITLSSALQFDHVGARDADGNLEFLPHVVNRTRNVIFESANPNGVRGHTLFQGRSDIDVRYAMFKHLGRTKNTPVNNTAWDNYGNATQVGTNQIARYAVHTHHLIGPTAPQSNGYQYTLVGNSIDNGSATHDNKWAVAIHGSHYGLIQQNTAYNIAGAAFVTEDGAESYNVFERNFVMRAYSVGSGWRYSVEAGNFHSGREATGFWFRGPNNYVRGNIATNITTPDQVETAWGFKYLFTFLGTKTIPVSQGSDPMVNGVSLDLNAQAILEFSDNEVYGATEGGLTYWWVGMFNTDVRNVSGTSVIKNLRAWHVWNRAIYAYHSNKVTIDGLVVRGNDPVNSAFGAMGYEAFDYPQKSSVIKNVDIQNMNKGLRLSTHPWDTVIEDSLLRNRERNIIPSLPKSCCGVINHPPASTTIRNVTYGPSMNQSSTADTIYMRYNKGGNLIQLNEVWVYDHNGVAGDDFQVYYLEQDPDFIVPQSTSVLIASPVAGLTNQQNWDTYGIAIAGAVSPTSQTRADIHGFVGPLATNTNHPPVSVPDSSSITEDSQPNTVSGNVLTNDSDADNDPLSVSEVNGNSGNVGVSTAGAYGSMVVNSNGSFVYTLDNFNQIVQNLNNGDTLTESYNYTLFDGTASSISSLTITINGVSDTNQPPVAVNDSATIVEDAVPDEVTGNVLSNDSDPDNDPLTVSNVEGSSSNVGVTLNGSFGTILINSNGGYRYTLDNSHPSVNALASWQSLSESFTYRASDGLMTDAAALTITINGNDDNVAPVGVNDSTNIVEDATPDDVTGNVLNNDTDANNDPLSVSQVEGSSSNVGVTLNGTYGTMLINSNGGYRYTLDNSNAAVNALNNGDTLSESFNYQVSDGSLNDLATLTVTINGATDGSAPIAVDDTASITEDASPNFVIGNVLINDSDPDNDPLNVSRVEGSAANVGVTLNGTYGTIRINADGTFQYTLDNANPSVNALNSGQALLEAFDYFATDGPLGDQATLTVTIQGVTDGGPAANATDFVGRSGDTLWLASSYGSSFTKQSAGNWSGSLNWSDVSSGDFNGDGLTDIVGRAPSGTWWVGLSTVNGITNQTWGSWSSSATWQDVMVADVDGDNDDDIVGRFNGTWWVARSNGTSFVNEQWGAWSDNVTWRHVSVADLNGDGSMDLLGRLMTDGSWWGSLSTGNSFQNVKFGGWSLNANWQDIRVADVNGDGSDDILGRFSGKWWVARSTGTSFVNELWGQWSTAINWVDVRVGDFDGDGRSDIAGRANGKWWVSRSTGTAFVNELWGQWSTSVTWHDIRVGDFDGDGSDDILGRLNDKWWVSRSASNSFQNELWADWADADWNDIQLGEFDN